MKKDLYNNLDSRAKEIIIESTPIKKEIKATDFESLIERPAFLNEAQPLAKESDYLHAALGWVYACVSVISDEIALIDLHLYKKTKNGPEEVVDNPVLDLLNKANDFTTKFDLFWNTQQYLELAGEAPWFLVRAENKTIVDILLLRPDLLTVVPGTDKFVEGYKYRTQQGKSIPLKAEDVIFLKYPDPTRAFRGKGTLQAAAKVVDIDNFSEDYNRNFFYNSAVPGSILKTDSKLTEETKKYLKHQMKKLYKGVDKAHQTMVLESGLSWEPMQVSQKDMDFLEQQKFSRDKILGIFRVPRTAIGITDDVNRANAEATDYVFAKRTVKPKMQRLIEQLNEFLLPQFAGTENMYLSYTDPVPENIEVRLKENESGLKNGYLTINEARENEGLNGIGTAGDKIYLPANLIPIETSIKKSIKKMDINVLAGLNGRNRKKTAKDNIKKEIKKEIFEKITPIIKEMLVRDNGKKKTKQRKRKE